MEFSREQASFVLDCSVTMAWCFEDEVTAYSEKVFEAMKSTSVLVPAIWPMEVTNVLLTAERKKRMTSVEIVNFRDCLTLLSVYIDEPLLHRAVDSIFEIARSTGITSYDASYLELAMRTKLPLATLDKALQKAAKKMHVSLFHS